MNLYIYYIFAGRYLMLALSNMIKGLFVFELSSMLIYMCIYVWI